MVERVKLFEPCYMEYENIGKPVHYTEEFLQELASVVNKTNLVFEEHLSDSIGDVSNFTFTDGALFGDVSTDKALDDLKYSPYFSCALQDDGDSWLAIKPTGLKDVALTSNPRKPVELPNTDEGGSKMSNEGSGDNETIKILNNQVKDLYKQLAIAENKNKANEEKLKRYDEMEKELEELRKTNETNSQLIEEQKPIIEAYKSDKEKRRADLLEKVSNGNEEVKNQLKDLPLETLETFDNLQSHDVPPQGIGANNAEGLNEGDGSDNPTEDELKQKEADDALAFYKKLHNGETPSFLNTQGGD